MSFLKYQYAMWRDNKLDPVTKLSVSEKFSTCWVDPATGERYRVSVAYEYNEKYTDAIENELLRSPKYNKRIKYKAKKLDELINSELTSGSYNMSQILTGLKFVTATDGRLQWEYCDDPDKDLELVLTDRVPSDIPKIRFRDLTEIKSWTTAFSAFTAEYLGVKHFVKAHVETNDNISFTAELEARIKIGHAPHICPMLGIVVEDSPLDGRSYVQGMLLPYVAAGSIAEILRCQDTSIEPEVKERWAAQIAHGIAVIHGAGVMHGDLNCENVVVDDHMNALIIDISDGTCWRPGWHPKLDNLNDPRKDIYGLGVVIWELIHDAEDLPCIGYELPIDSRGKNYPRSFLSLIDDCHVELVDKRASLQSVIDRLGDSSKCGCRSG